MLSRQHAALLKQKGQRESSSFTSRSFGFRVRVCSESSFVSCSFFPQMFLFRGLGFGVQVSGFGFRVSGLAGKQTHENVYRKKDLLKQKSEYFSIMRHPGTTYLPQFRCLIWLLLVSGFGFRVSGFGYEKRRKSMMRLHKAVEKFVRVFSP